jgi:hypothetical protein
MPKASAFIPQIIYAARANAIVGSRTVLSVPVICSYMAIASSLSMRLMSMNAPIAVRKIKRMATHGPRVSFEQKFMLKTADTAP